MNEISQQFDQLVLLIITAKATSNTNYLTTIELGTITLYIVPNSIGIHRYFYQIHPSSSK